MSIRNPHHGRGGSRHVGRVRIAAAKIINAAIPDVHVDPEDISPATGSYRTDWRQDVVRWEVFGKSRDSDGTVTSVPWVGQSWQRLTEFVKNAKAGGKVNVDMGGDIWCEKPTTNRPTYPI